MLMKSVLIAICLICVSLNAVAYADDEPMKKSYVAIKGGLFKNIPLSAGGTSGYSDNELGTLSEKAYNVEVVLGYRLFRYFGAELGAGYYTARNAETGDYYNQMQVIPITLNGIFTIPIGSAVNFFSGGGVGYYMEKAKYGSAGSEYSGYYGSSGTYRYTSTPRWNKSNVIGAQALAGIDINLTDSISIGGEYKYMFASSKFEDDDADYHKKMGGQIFNVGVKFRY
jgi:opacity protein-like surface antigen